MKRYLLFCWSEWDCGGGLDNLVGDYDTVEEASAARHKENTDIGQILDTQTGEQILPTLLTHEKIQKIITHYENQTESEAVEEDSKYHRA